MTVLVLILMSQISVSSPVQAVHEDRWQVTVEPYVWALGNKVRIATDQYDRSDYTGYLDALFNQYQYGFLGAVKIHKRKWGLYMDGHFVRLKDSGRELGLPYKSDIRQFLVEASLMYRMGDDVNYTEFFAGARYFRMRSQVDVAIAGRYQDLFEWIEPQAGVRVSRAPGNSRRWRWQVTADIGGFDLGSDLTWQIQACLAYRLTERHSVSAGYRHIDIKYKDGPRRYESRMSGPLFGVIYHF